MFFSMATLVHVTHEAVQQAGGIGTVLRGLITARSYQAHCQRTILLGPLTDPDSAQPLGPDGEILYDASRSIRDSQRRRPAQRGRARVWRAAWSMADAC